MLSRINSPASTILSCLPAILFLLSSCLGEKKQIRQSFFSDKEIQDIHRAQLLGDTALISDQLESKKHHVRLEACKVAASMPSTSLIPHLMRRNQNEQVEIQQLANFALGQYRAADLMDTLEVLFATYTDTETQAELMKALAKSLPPATDNSRQMVDDLFGFISHRNDEHTMAYAYALAIAARKGYHTHAMLDKLRYMLSVSEIPNRPRIAACMAAGSDSWFQQNESYLQDWLKVERNSEVKISILQMLAKTKSDFTKETLLAFACDASQSRYLRIRSIELLKKFKVSPDALLCAVDDTEELIAITAFNNLESAASPALLKQWIDHAHGFSSLRKTAMWRYLSRINYPHADDSLLLLYHSTSSVYDRSACAESFAESSIALRQMVDLILGESIPPVRYALCTALLQRYSNPKTTVDYPMEEAILALLSTKDIGAIAIAGEICLMLKPEKANDLLIKEISNALLQLNLPVEVETYLALNKALSHLGQQEISRNIRPSYQPDWNYIQSLPSHFKALVHTTRGDFEITFNTQDAIFSTAALHQWIDEGFYNGKFFHRVVPNFVIQTGCPRGDGMGSASVTLPSEFSRQAFTKWKVGLASSGKDTESSQWFITTGEAYWLDGRYTVVGDVTAGFDVIENIRIGDQIISMQILP